MRRLRLRPILYPILRPILRPVPVLLLAALGACTSQPDAKGAAVRALEIIGQSIARGPDAAPPQLTRAVLNTIDGEFIEVKIEKNGSTAFLYISAERQGRAAGDEGGRLLVWRTENDVTLTTRDGVLVATRGLGNDLISSDSMTIRASLAGRRPGQGARREVFSALDNKAVEMDLACEIAALGRETIEIVERRHSTDKIRETCTLQGGTVINDYWIDTAGPTIWQSRQWAGPYIGYVRIRQLTP